jgi:hypothetical protein
MAKKPMLQSNSDGVVSGSIKAAYPTEFTGLRDMGNQQATYSDHSSVFAQYAKDKGITADSISDENKTELFAGYAVRYNVLHPAQVYLREGEDNYIPLGEAKAPEGRETVSIGIDVVLAYTTSAFGQLRSTRPNYHGLIKAMREAFRVYASGKLGDLHKYIAKFDGVTKERTRAVNLEFKAYLFDAKKGVIDVMKTRNKNARSKGDGTAVPDDVLKEAIDAFHLVMETHYMTK